MSGALPWSFMAAEALNTMRFRGEENITVSRAGGISAPEKIQPKTFLSKPASWGYLGTS
jgi:hypothetical protein